MKTIEDLFIVHHARSDAYSDYEPGHVAYLTNGFTNNALVGYVEPRRRDRVFTFRALVVSAFCEATVQMPPFIAYGAAGTSLTVLEPREAMTVGQLAFLAAYINRVHRWRFNWYRRSTPTRVWTLSIPDTLDKALFPVRDALPVSGERLQLHWTAQFEQFVLDDIFLMKPGMYHSLSELLPGATPVVSCGETNNGIDGYYDVQAEHTGMLTIALNGSPLTTKYHPYSFATKDDVALCTPREPLAISTLLFIQIMMNRERWRYSYYRKCYLDKLRRFSIALPAKDSHIDEASIAEAMATAPYWEFLTQKLVRGA